MKSLSHIYTATAPEKALELGCSSVPNRGVVQGDISFAQTNADFTAIVSNIVII